MAVTFPSRARPVTWTLAAAVVLAAAPALLAQGHLTSPKEQFGWNVGDDYRLATYTQLTEYWKKLASESPRMRLVPIGKTAEGRDQWMMLVSSPANLARLDRYKEIAARLARAEALTDDQAHALAREGKAVVWIDGGLHATEVLGSHQLIEHLWQMASRDDPETLRILDDVIQLVIHANPDGMELVSGWYMRRTDSTRRSMSDLPRLYHKYVGHDDNRDFYLNAMPESENMSRVMYREWYPQIMYNHHQAGPAGTVMFAPPFRDPHNYFFDPLVVDEISLVGAAMHSRFSAEGKPGITERYGATYQTWFNGGLRTTAYFHNIVGILTETIGSPTPMQIPFVPDRQLSNSDLPYPIAPQPWHFRQSIDYSITANRAILDFASRYRETLLYNIYQMGRNAIARGGTDSWTTTSREIEAVKAEAAKDRSPQPGSGGAGGGAATGVVPTRYFEQLHRPADRDPRGYILPSDQPDFLTATKFVNALIKSGIDVQRATAAFTVAGKQYPAGSYVVKAAQAFRPHVLDMFEPQDYPDDLLYPGGPPRPPYDNAGYTLALQMGVRFDRILEGFDGPFVKVADLLAKPPVTVTLGKGRGYLVDRRINDGFLAVNRLLAAKQAVRVTTRPLTVNGVTYPTGSWYVPSSGPAAAIVKRLAEEKGLPAVAVSAGPGPTLPLQPVHVGLWDQYGGSMPSGWTRWMFEQFEFPFEVVYPQQLDAGNLKNQFDVLVFVDGGIPGPAAGAAATASRRFGSEAAEDLPAEFKSMTGRVTVEKTVPQLKTFLEAGGRIVTIGSSTALARYLGLPIENQLVERTPDGQVRPLPREKFYVPASLLEVSIDTTATSALGLGPTAIVMFDESPVLKLGPAATKQGIRTVAWYANGTPLRSGWAWGQSYLNGGVAAAEAKVGAGTLYLYGPEITFRSQPHGTYKFLFNAIYGR
jgi:hypothetical protein